MLFDLESLLPSATELWGLLSLEEAGGCSSGLLYDLVIFVALRGKDWARLDLKKASCSLPPSRSDNRKAVCLLTNKTNLKTGSSLCSLAGFVFLAPFRFLYRLDIYPWAWICLVTLQQVSQANRRQFCRSWSTCISPQSQRWGRWIAVGSRSRTRHLFAPGTWGPPNRWGTIPCGRGRP